MVLVDTCGWIEWLADGPLVDRFLPYLEAPETLVVPTIVQFELYKWLDRNQGEQAAMKAIARTTRSLVVDLDMSVALLAAELSRDHRLSVADAVIYAITQMTRSGMTCSPGDTETSPFPPKTPTEILQ